MKRMRHRLPSHPYRTPAVEPMPQPGPRPWFFARHPAAWPMLATALWFSFMLTLLACGPKPWPTYARAGISATSEALAIADHVLAQVMREAAARDIERYAGAVSAAQLTHEGLLLAERRVDAAERIADAESKCRASMALADAATLFGMLGRQLVSVNVNVPPELVAAATTLGTEAQRIADACTGGEHGR